MEADAAGALPGEREAVERLTRAWVAAVPAAMPGQPHPQQTLQQKAIGWCSPSRWWTASAIAAVGVGLFAIGAATGPRRAFAQVADAMSRVQVFQFRLEVPGYGVEYRVWGARSTGARVEEWEGNHRSLVLVDDGTRLWRYDPDDNELRSGTTRVREFYRKVAGFSAARLLRQAARGRLFGGDGWLGKATAREVRPVVRDGRRQRQIQVDLTDGFFERMMIYADAGTGRLTQANLYTDSRTPPAEPFARAFFQYPDRVAPDLFRAHFPPDARVRPGSPVQGLHP